MKFFRPDHSYTSSCTWKYLFWGGIALLVVGSFFLQMSMGLCPVP